jgi:hypothetical protein
MNAYAPAPYAPALLICLGLCLNPCLSLAFGDDREIGQLPPVAASDHSRKLPTEFRTAQIDSHGRYPFGQYLGGYRYPFGYPYYRYRPRWGPSAAVRSEQAFGRFRASPQPDIADERAPEDGPALTAPPTENHAEADDDLHAPHDSAYGPAAPVDPGWGWNGGYPYGAGGYGFRPWGYYGSGYYPWGYSPWGTYGLGYIPFAYSHYAYHGFWHSYWHPYGAYYGWAPAAGMNDPHEMLPKQPAPNRRPGSRVYGAYPKDGFRGTD